MLYSTILYLTILKTCITDDDNPKAESLLVLGLVLILLVWLEKQGFHFASLNLNNNLQVLFIFETLYSLKLSKSMWQSL